MGRLLSPSVWAMVLGVGEHGSICEAAEPCCMSLYIFCMGMQQPAGVCECGLGPNKHRFLKKRDV